MHEFTRFGVLGVMGALVLALVAVLLVGDWRAPARASQHDLLAPTACDADAARRGLSRPIMFLSQPIMGPF